MNLTGLRYDSSNESKSNQLPCQIIDWGLIDYLESVARQEELVEQIYQSQSAGALVFCQHPPVVTKGRKTESGDITSWSGEIVEVARGGRATYHGPNQLVVYPIVNLSHSLRQNGRSRPTKDLAWYLRSLETAIVETLGEYGVKATGKPGPDQTGVWVNFQNEMKKIASIGVAVRHWVTYHGLALNLHNDPKAFQGLNPCGFSSNIMISLEEILGGPVNQAEFASRLQNRLLENLF